jgi:hypothetical protein
VESSCELGNEPSGSISENLPSGCTTCGLSSGNQLHRVSSLYYNLLKYGISVTLQFGKDVHCAISQEEIVLTLWLDISLNLLFVSYIKLLWLLLKINCII